MLTTTQADSDWEVVPSHPESREDQFKREKISYIIAGLLIPGKGKPAENQAVISVNGIIEYVGKPDSVPCKYADIKPLRVPFLLPGFWECHGHFMPQAKGETVSISGILVTPAVEMGARIARLAHDTLYAGYTSFVELGGYGAEVKKVIDEGSIAGPNIYPAGAALSMTAGHGDAFDLPLGCAWQKQKPGFPGNNELNPSHIVMADGPDECRKAVRMNLRRGAKIIKVFTSGGVISRDDDPRYQQYSDEELAVIASEAGRMGLNCTAHAESKPGIKAAIRAGFKVIQHASDLDEDMIADMKRRGVMGVFTMSPLEALWDRLDDYPPHIRDKARQIARMMQESYRRAIKAGVLIALGSDLFGPPGDALTAGTNGKEIVYAVKYGMTPLQAIESATANGPLVLGSQAPKSGQIRVGYDADFVGVESDPLEDIEVLGRPGCVKWIWKGGKLVKAPGLDPWAALDA
jgi:imidazolonepropionase-like amidohydrolase